MNKDNTIPPKTNTTAYTSSKIYPAPRQGRFALVLLVSLCLHILGFVLTTENAQRHQEQKTVDELLVQLTEEVKLPLAISDRISLSVIAERYVANPEISFIGIYDTQDTLLVPKGENVEVEGKTVNVTEGAIALGRIEIKPTPINRAVIMGEHWLYLLASLVLHVLIWVAYATIARPPRQLQDEIAREVRYEMAFSAPIKPEPSLAPTPEPVPVPEPTPMPVADEEVEPLVFDKNKTIAIKIAFVDKHNLVGVISKELLAGYLALCDQLLEKSLRCLCANAIASKISYQIIKPFDKHGATVILTTEDAHARLSLTSAMFVKLFVAVNYVVYKKHRDLGQFALPMKIIAVDGNRLDIAEGILAMQQDNALIMVENAKVSQVSQHITLHPINSANSIHEKDTYVLTHVNENIDRILDTLRKEILSVD